MDLAKINFLVQTTDVGEWIHKYPTKLPLVEFCKKFDLDIENDQRNKLFWNLHLNQSIVVDDLLLTYLGYSGIYNQKKSRIVKLLKKNPQIQFTEVDDNKDIRKKHIVLNVMDMETLMMQMRTDKCMEIRQLFSIIKYIMTKYCEYEKYHSHHLAELLTTQNQTLLTAVKDFRSSYEEERKRAEEERKRAEDARLFAAEAERRHEDERRLAAARHSQLSNQLQKNTKILRKDIGPNLSPLPISKNKCRNLGKFYFIVLLCCY